MAEFKVPNTKHLRTIEKQILMVEQSRFIGTEAPAYTKASDGRKAKVEVAAKRFQVKGEE